jgi:hypothetical protein
MDVPNIEHYTQKSGPAHERAEVIERLLKFMGDQRWGYWLGRTKHLTPQDIYRMMRNAEEGKNPHALFNHLLKKSR